MASGIPTKVRSLVVARDSASCARCGILATRVPASVHHRRPRMMGGTRDPRIDDPRNLVVVCGSGTTGCHGWIESHRNQARESGWLLESLDELDRPLLTILGTRIVLAADGGRDDIWPADDLLPREVTR